MKKLFLFLVCIMVLLCGCQSEPDPEAIDFSTAPTLPLEEVTELPILCHGEYGAQAAPKRCAPTEDGIFISEDTDYGLFKRIYFAELDTGEVYPLCVKVNCSHETEECSAMAYGLDYHYDGTYFYHVSTWNSANSYLVRQRADGSDQETVFRLAKETKQPTSITKIGSIVYEGKMAYFTTFGTYIDPETQALSHGEMIAISDLTTGAITTIPLNFGDGGNAATLRLQGKYGDNLIVSCTRKTGLLTEQYTMTGFLLDLNTYDITVLYEDSYSASDPPRIAKTFAIGEGILILDDGDKKIIDLAEEKCYSLAHETLEDLWVLDGNWIYTQSGSANYVQSIRTGEMGTWPENMQDIKFQYSVNHSALDYFLVHVNENGKWHYATIRKSDFWSGKRILQFYPDWASLF